MNFKKIVFFFLIVLLSGNLCSQTEKKTLKFAISPGLNISNLKMDSIETKSFSMAQLRVLLKKDFKFNLGLITGLQLSTRGYNQSLKHNLGWNTYVDFQLIPQYQLFDFLKIQVGAQYSHLIKGPIFQQDISNSTENHSSQIEFLTGLEFFLEKNVSLDFKYTIPLKSMQYTNFQVSLNLYLNKDPFKRKIKEKVNSFGMNIIDCGYSEDEGIIYPANLSKPPRYNRGEVDLYQYLEDYIRLNNLDYDYKNLDYNFFELKIDTLGKVFALDAKEKFGFGHGRGYQVGHLSNKIIETLEAMPNWKPAYINGQAVETTIYLPLKLELRMDRIEIKYSKYLVPFKNRVKVE